MKDNLKNKIPSIQAVAMPADTNPSGDIFGGWVLSQMDLAGSVLARQITKKRVTTVAVDKMRFHKPIMVGDIVSFYTEVNRTGNTSITIDITTMVTRKNNLLGEDQAIMVTEGKFVYVCIDAKGKPIKTS
ncbi:acyl-CoA thioesterase [Alphaproteobacteria bacterium]|nr:acyl-CoA thioesterase [Alphaproteobacteria bacterium]